MKGKLEDGISLLPSFSLGDSEKEEAKRAFVEAIF